MHLCSSYMVPHMIPLGNYIFPRSTNKIQFLMKFPHLEKLVDLMKALKYEHQSILPLWGKVKLNFRDRYGKPNIYFNNSSCYQLFSSNSQKLSLWCKKKSFLTHMNLYDPYMVPYTIP